ncbi:DUF2188 domain-containing protein [Kocuria sediminis]|uniref:DUF2188 domain-containing protein n=1 Tax=Kocuria sediminis TaxID=1038857 RepID=A0A6N8GSU5_9MICC|nr:DUF2188 domain-containing protein [Kocuria sediminis]MUN64373.1 DUF2188 domain-containing protein [Kocuria sediminis]
MAVVSASVDRVVARSPLGGWEVRAPGSRWGGLRASTRAGALQWAWNITRDTGGRVLLHPGAAPGRGSVPSR